MENETKYVIACEVDGTDEVRFIVRDSECGYVFGTRDLSSAHMFHEVAQAVRVYDAIKREKVNVVSDGTRFPPISLHTGLGICYARPQATGSITIRPVTLGNPCAVWHVEGKIEHPVGYIY